MSDNNESVHSSMSYQYTSRPKKTLTQLKDEFRGLIESTYGVNSKEYDKFNSLVEGYKSYRVARNQFRYSIQKLFCKDMKVYVSFCETLLPSLTPEISEFKEQLFLYATKLAFIDNLPENPKVKSYENVRRLIKLFKDGDISLQYLTLEMRQLLKDEMEVMAEFTSMLPDSLLVSEQGQSNAMKLVVAFSSALVLLLAFIILAFSYGTN